MGFSKQEYWSELPRPPPGNPHLLRLLHGRQIRLSTGEAHTYHTVHYISRAYLLLIVSLYPLKILFCPQSPNPWWPPFYSVFVCVAFLDSIYECCSTTGRCYLTLVRKGSGQKTRKNKCLQECGAKGAFVHCWWECRLVQPLLKRVWRFLKKLKMELPYDSAIPLLGIFLKEMKTGSRRDLFTPMFLIPNSQDVETI